MKLVFLLIGFVLTSVPLATAQQPAKIPRIGELVSGSRPALGMLWYRYATVERKPVGRTRIGLQLHSMQVSSTDKLENAFKEAARLTGRGRCPGNPIGRANAKQIVALAAKNRLPAVYARRDFRRGWLNLLWHRPIRSASAVNGRACGLSGHSEPNGNFMDISVHGFLDYKPLK